MVAFAIRPTSRAPDANEIIGRALDEPFTFTGALSEQFQQNILDSFGLGTAIRDISTPQGNVPRGSMLETMPIIGPIYSGAKSYAEAFRPDQPSLTKDEYQSSPYFRDEIPWEPGMTEDRAAALAGYWDEKAVRSYFSEKQPIASFLGSLAGQAFDPANYIPVFGPVARVAAIARAGSVVGRTLIGGTEAMVNTAAFALLTADVRKKFGDDVSWQTVGMEIATSAVIGGAFGATGGLLLRGRDLHDPAILMARKKMDNNRNGKEFAIAMNEAIDTLGADGEVRMTPNSQVPMERMSVEMEGRIAKERAAEIARTDAPNTSKTEITINGETRTIEGASPRGVDPGLSDVINATVDEMTARTDAPRFNGLEERAEDQLDLFGDEPEGGEFPSPAPVRQASEEAASAPVMSEDEIAAAGLTPAQEAIERAWRAANRLSVVEDIEAAAADGLTAKQTVARLGGRLDEIDQAAIANEEAWAAQGNKETLVRSVRIKRGVPSIDDRAEFAAWRDRYLTTKTAANANGARFDNRAAPPDAPTEGMDEAAARVGKTDTMSQVAEDRGVNLTTGEFAEQFEIEQLRATNALTVDQIAVLDEAEVEYKKAVSLGNALKAGVHCILGGK